MSKITQDFRRSALRNGVAIRANRTYDTPENIAYAAVIELANLGFKVHPNELKGMSPDALGTLVRDARNVIGADRNMRAIYPGFPKQVQELDTLTLVVEQLLHYWTAGQFLPNYPDVAREGLPLEDMVRVNRELRVLNASNTARHFIDTLTTRGVALSEDERELLKGSVELRGTGENAWQEVANVLKRARHGENMQTLVTALAQVSNENASRALTLIIPEAKNPDQLLRFVLALATTPVVGREDDYERAVFNLSDRDATAVKMRTVSKPARRTLLVRLGELTRFAYNADPLVNRQDIWRRVMRMVHPYSLSAVKEPSVKRAVDIVHSNIEYRTLNSVVEQKMNDGAVSEVSTLLLQHQPGNLLRRIVALLRLVKSDKQAIDLAGAISEAGKKSTVTTLVSAYNGVIAVNDDHARVNRVAGRNNTMLSADERKVNVNHVMKVAEALQDALQSVLATKQAPEGSVGVVSEQNLPLVRRDLSSSERVMNRGEVIAPVGEGDTVRIFSHWVNNVSRNGGYMDVGAVVLNSNFESLVTATWNSWMDCRDWSTYSGDKFVYPGKDAAEFIDVNVPALLEVHPDARWVAMTIQSYSGLPMGEVDMIAGTMLRSKPNSGEPFDARSVATAFSPTTDAFQAVPLVLNLETREMVWIDSSSGSTEVGISAVQDDAVGPIVYDEIQRPRMTFGEFALLWAKAHDAETHEGDVDSDALLALLD